MNIIEKIQLSEFVYSTFTKWGLKKYMCNLEYYTKETLNDLFFVICSVLDANGGEYNKRSLGMLLGFSMYNDNTNGQHTVYYDLAEVRIFEDILAETEKEHLITINDNAIFLTELGHLSLMNNTHYTFHRGSQAIYEHLNLKSDFPTASRLFPFYKDMGISTNLETSKSFWPEDEEINEIVNYDRNQLLKQLENHSVEQHDVYFAEQEKYFDVEIKRVQINLYYLNGEYIPVVMNGNQIAEQATKLILYPINSTRKEDLIHECLFQKIWDNKDAILNYEVLNPYFELVDFEELTKDSRTVWSDNQLFSVITENSSQSDWRNISRFCDLDVLYSNIEIIKDNLDWPIFTGRVDDDYLIHHFLDYPWDLEILSEDENRDIKTIEKLILLQKDTKEDWNWEYLAQRLSKSFVLDHLDIVKVNLSEYTEDNHKVRESILYNSNCRWDWEKVESIFGLDFILNNISVLGIHFSFSHLLDRVFTDEVWAEKYVYNNDFQNVIRHASEGNGPLVSCVLNNKAYIWSPYTIDFFLSLGLLNWSSTPYMKGFECNPSLKWTPEFFEKYSRFIVTEEGHSIVSRSIEDINILINNPYFAWSWNDISANLELTSEVKLYNNFGEKLNWDIVVRTQDNLSFLQEIENIESMIGDDKAAWATFSEKASLEYVITQYKAKGFPWDWTVLTKRMFDKLKFENIGHHFFIDKWDWDYLSEHINKDFLWENLEKYSNHWNWSLVLNRILSPSNRLDYNILDKLAYILTNITGREKCNVAWSAFTKQYSFKELKRLIKETMHKRSYWWDINYFCQHEDFNVFIDLDEFRNIIAWDVISKSKAVDKSFKFNSKLKIKIEAWNDDLMKLLSDKRNHWDFKSLSTFESLRNQKWFLSKYFDKIDWEYLSQNSKIFAEKDKQELNVIIEHYKKFINFKTLSERTDVNLEYIMKIYPEADYDYNSLIERGVVQVSMDIVNKRPDYDWNW